MEHQPLHIVLLGAPGCGKGTQAQHISREYQLNHISTGVLFREEIASGSPLGKHIAEIINNGGLCSTEMTLDILARHLKSCNPRNGYIFDGVPRTIEQAEMMDGINYPARFQIDHVVDIHVNEKVSYDRILKRAEIENRADDTIEVLEKRIANYFELTKPLEQYYAAQGKLQTINGMQSIEEVFADICKLLG
ncbi:MAG: adenylate kinase [Bacteroidales bacterium]|nr:adenylate kinase [Bacteroidales bacterium]